MEDQLQNKLVEILSQIQQGVKQAGSFAMEQLPDIAQQYVLWGRVSNTVTCLFILLFVVIFGTISYKVWSKPWFDTYNDVAGSCWAIRTIIPCFCVISVVILMKTIDWMVWFAPKVWLLKELSILIK